MMSLCNSTGRVKSVGGDIQIPDAMSRVSISVEKLRTASWVGKTSCEV